MPNTLRAFIALPIPAAVTTFIGRIQEGLRSSLDAVRWVPPANIHLTLIFLGDIDPSAVPAITARMDGAAGLTPPLSFRASGMGVFPSFRQARVLWVGLSGDLERLGSLQADLACQLEEIGFPRESRAFRAHLTIGRTRRGIDPKHLEAALKPFSTGISETFRADRLLLLQSELRPSGAVYRGLHATTLCAAATPAEED